AAAALCRYVAAGFAIFQAGPILAWLLFERWRKERDVARAVLAPMAVIGMILAVLAGPFLLRHLGVNVFYYSELAYGLGQGPVAAARFLFNFLTDYAVAPSPPLAVLQVAVLARVAIFPLLAFPRDRDRALGPLLISLWLGLSIPVFLIFILQTPADPSAALYTLPGVVVALLAPTVLPDEDSTRRWLRRSSTVLVCLALVIGARAASAGWRWATHPSQDADFNRAWVTPVLPDLHDVKAFDRALAEALVGQGRGLVWNAFFDETGHIQTMEAFRRSGVLVLPAGPRYFSIHEPYWRGFYPGMSAPQVSERVYAAAGEWVDIAVVLGDPVRVETISSRVNDQVGNPFTRYVARDIAERVRADPRWRPVFELDSARYGRVVGYRNLAAGGRGYRAVLESHEIFSSPIDP
ncbi:MAG TPA: hypothetical protein VMV21_09370, partial [Vicinamibacteria bacterium]|nr:hypothetical protein [Vicinamibacteria bacterium]